MTDDAGSNAEHDLLSRLNALKRSNVELETKTCAFLCAACSWRCAYRCSYNIPTASHSTSIDSVSARALHTDLLDRFKSLHGSNTASTDKSGDAGGLSNYQTKKSEDDKTIEELLADLGPLEQWDVHKSERDDVEELLRAADAALKKQPELEKVPGEVNDAQEPLPAQLPSLDMSVFQPEPDSEEENKPKQTRAQTRNGVDKEADDVLKRFMDEVEYEQKHDAEDAGSSKGSEDEGEEKPSWEHDLPAAPSKELESAPENAVASKGDEDLALRLASLSLPSVPTALKSNSGTEQASTARKFTDEEIETWCIICNDDATLKCIGCDGDLYCTNCWMEGHRSDDAGYDERTHKAVQFVKGGGKKKQKSKRVMMGA